MQEHFHNVSFKLVLIIMKEFKEYSDSELEFSLDVFDLVSVSI